MKKFKRRLKYILNGEFEERFKKQPKVIRLKYYLSAKPKKNFFIQLYEVFLLAVHWKQFPYPYFTYAMFIKSCKLSMGEMKGYIPDKVMKMKVHNIDYAIIAKDKALFSDLMSYYDLPQVHVIFKCVKGTFLDAKNRIVS